MNTQQEEEEEDKSQRQQDPTKKWTFRRRGAHIQAERSTRLWDKICGQDADCRPLMAEIQAHRQKLYMTQREYTNAAAIGSLGNKYNRDFNAGPSEHTGQVAVSSTMKSAEKLLINLKKLSADEHLIKQLIKDLTKFIQNANNLILLFYHY